MTGKDKKKKSENVGLDVCIESSVAEHARPNEPPQDACDDGRAGTGKNRQVPDRSK